MSSSDSARRPRVAEAIGEPGGARVGSGPPAHQHRAGHRHSGQGHHTGLSAFGGHPHQATCWVIVATSTRSRSVGAASARGGHRGHGNGAGATWEPEIEASRGQGATVCAAGHEHHGHPRFEEQRAEGGADGPGAEDHQSLAGIGVGVGHSAT